jgi:hypothetical protein
MRRPNRRAALLSTELEDPFPPQIQKQTKYWKPSQQHGSQCGIAALGQSETINNVGLTQNCIQSPNYPSYVTAFHPDARNVNSKVEQDQLQRGR